MGRCPPGRLRSQGASPKAPNALCLPPLPRRAAQATLASAHRCARTHVCTRTPVCDSACARAQMSSAKKCAPNAAAASAEAATDAVSAEAAADFALFVPIEPSSDNAHDCTDDVDERPPSPVLGADYPAASLPPATQPDPTPARPEPIAVPDADAQDDAEQQDAAEQQQHQQDADPEQDVVPATPMTPAQSPPVCDAQLHTAPRDPRRAHLLPSARDLAGAMSTAIRPDGRPATTRTAAVQLHTIGVIGFTTPELGFQFASVPPLSKCSMCLKRFRDIRDVCLLDSCRHVLHYDCILARVDDAKREGHPDVVTCPFPNCARDMCTSAAPASCDDVATFVRASSTGWPSSRHDDLCRAISNGNSLRHSSARFVVHNKVTVTATVPSRPKRRPDEAPVAAAAATAAEAADGDGDNADDEPPVVTVRPKKTARIATPQRQTFSTALAAATASTGASRIPTCVLRSVLSVPNWVEIKRALEAECKQGVARPSPDAMSSALADSSVIMLLTGNGPLIVPVSKLTPCMRMAWVAIGLQPGSKTDARGVLEITHTEPRAPETTAFTSEEVRTWMDRLDAERLDVLRQLCTNLKRISVWFGESPHRQAVKVSHIIYA